MELLGTFLLFGLTVVGLAIAIAGVILANWLLYQRLRSPNWNIARRRVRRQMIQWWVGGRRGGD